MKKICFLDVDMSAKGGVEQVAANLANRLSKRYQVSIISLCKSKDAWAYRFRKEVSVVTFAVNNETPRIREMASLYCKKIRDYLKEEKIDCLFLMGTYTGFIGSVAAVGLKTKVVFCDHGALMNQWHEKDTTTLRFVSAMLSNRIVTLTEKTRQDYIKQFHIRPKKIRCIYNGIDSSLTARRQPYDLESRQIMTAGRFGVEKGYDLLVEVAKIVLPKHPDWQWHLYGDGETFEDIKQKALEYHLEDQLIFMGMADSIYKLYKDYAMVVLPSYREGLPLVLLEAKASGIPMVSFDVATGPSEIIDDGKDGILVPPYDLKKMAAAIEKLMDTPQLRQEYSDHTQCGIGKFEMKSILKQWARLIEER